MPVCPCLCHRPDYADWRRAMQRGPWEDAAAAGRKATVNTPTRPDTRDPLAAALACDACKDAHHCDALLTRRLWDDHETADPSAPTDPWTDPPPPPITLNPDGD